MRSTWLTTAGVALVCLPCLLVLFVGAGIGAGALSLIGSALSEPGLVIVAAFLAVLLFAGAAIVLVRRRKEPACETGLTPATHDELPRRTNEVAALPGGDQKT